MFKKHKENYLLKKEKRSVRVITFSLSYSIPASLKKKRNKKKTEKKKSIITLKSILDAHCNNHCSTCATRNI